MKRTLLILVTTLVMTNVGIAQKTVNVYQDCSKNGKTVDVRIEGSECGHAWVDLGLSVKWATMNIGANAPEEFGDQFAWGETEPKTTFLLTNYKFYNGNRYSYSKYSSSAYKYWILEKADDAANVNWGGNWRMPTYEECDELRAKCTTTFVVISGVSMVKITSTINGHFIYLPSYSSTKYWTATGYSTGSSSSSTPEQVYALFSYANTSKQSANVAVLNSDTPDNPVYGVDYSLGRYRGFYVRPVCDK